jgi:hypothetical protein
MEFDLFGDVVIRSSRLEAYTKDLGKALNSNKSLIILSPSAEVFLPTDHAFLRISSIGQIRDFPDIKYIYFREVLLKASTLLKNIA